MKRWLVWLIPAVALCSIVGWRLVGKVSDSSALRAQQSQRQNAAPNVELTIAGPATIEHTVEAVGTVESPYAVKLSAKTAGSIRYLEVREGAEVKPGQVLVKIDPSDLQGQLLQQESVVAEARAKLAQAALTQNANATTVNAQIRQQRAGYDSAKADLDQTTQNYTAQVAAANAQVTDTEAKLAGAKTQVDAAQADVDSAQANLDNAKTKLARMEALFKQQFVAAQDVDDARAVMKVQTAAVQSAKQKLGAARQVVHSAEAQVDVATKQARIVKTKGLSDIAAAKARFAQAGASYQVARANSAQTPAYQENIRALKAGVAAAVAQVAQVRSKIADTVLRSSIEGTVTARNLDAGSLATPGQVILTVQYLRWLYVTCSLPVEQSSQVYPGQSATVTFDALPGQTFEGKVGNVNPAADPASRQFSVQIRLDNPHRLIRPGMYGKVQLITGVVRAAVAVPREAIETVGGQQVVFVVDQSSVVHASPVAVGATSAAMEEIKSGVQVGDRVVVLSYANLRDGQKVRYAGSQGKRGRQ